MSDEQTQETEVEIVEVVEDTPEVSKDELEINIVKDVFGFNEDNDNEPEETEEPKKEDELSSEEPKQERISKILSNATAKEKELATREKELNDRSKEFDEWNAGKELLDTDVLGFLDKHGYTLDSLADAVLGKETNTEVDPIKSLEEKVKKLEQDKLDQEQNSLKHEQKRLLDNFKGEINAFFDDKSEEYPMTIRTENTSLIYDYMTHIASTTGKLPPINEVAQEVEEELTKYAKALQDTGTEEVEDESDQEQQDIEQLVKRKPKTLSNKKSKTTKKGKSANMTTEQRNQEADDIIKKMFF